MIAREVRAPRELGAVGARLVERVQHHVDQLAQAVGHAHILIAFDVLTGRDAAPRGTVRAMASWSEFAAAAPELAERVQERLDAHRHKTIATLRSDGSPRISGTEAGFVDGELTIGSMWQALKARDLQRDPRFALHSGSDEPDDWDGDAKLAGVAEELRARRHGRRALARDSGSTCTRSRSSGLNEERDGLVIDVWTADGGLRTDPAQVSERLRRIVDALDVAARRARARDRLRPRRRDDLPARARRARDRDRPLAEDDRGGARGATPTPRSSSATLEDVDLGERRFDAILAVRVGLFHREPERARALAERWLAPGGRLRRRARISRRSAAER